MQRTTFLLLLTVSVPAAARATDVTPAIRASTHDEPVDGNADSFNSTPFEGLIRRIGTSQDDRAIQEFDVAAFAGQSVQSATLSGTVHSNNSFDVGVRTFEFRLYAGNGSADLADHQAPTTLVGTASYHPPAQTSFTYSFDVTSAVASLLAGGASWIGLRVQSGNELNFPNVLDGATSRLAIGVSTATVFCAGDGGAAACPCGNASSPGAGQGCLSSLGTGGALRASGVASVAQDTVVLLGTLMPNAPALYFQGTSEQSGGSGVAFGDGLRCAGGTIVRLGTKTNTGGASQYPEAGDAPVSVRGLVPAGGGVRTYQTWYRNAATFCTSATFNLTNGLSIAWSA